MVCNVCTLQREQHALGYVQSQSPSWGNEVVLWPWHLVCNMGQPEHLLLVGWGCKQIITSASFNTAKYLHFGFVERRFLPLDVTKGH
jgi:hypothetical protein